MEEIKVTVPMLTYNHRNFVHRAIESVLCQKTNFHFELVIGDDASQDGTQEVLQSYASKYPDIIYLVLHKKNVGIAQNIQSIRPFYRGRYISSLEGDDYWIDPNKLQRQVDFLERNPQYSGIAAKVQLIDEIGNPLSQTVNSKLYYTGDIFTLKQFEEYKMAGQINTMTYRSPYFFESKYQKNDLLCQAMGDRKTNLLLVVQGNIKCENIVTTAYRMHKGSWSNSICCKEYNAYSEMLELQSFAKKQFEIHLDFRKSKLKAWYGIVIRWFLHPNKVHFKMMTTTFFQEKNQFSKIVFLIFHTLNWPFRKLIERYKT